MAKFSSPCAGRLISIEQVPSEAFSQKMMGDGFAIELDDYEVVAPIDGTIQGVFPTGHAVMMTTAEGIEVLIHIGIDTYKVGEGFFQLCVKEGDKVKQGDLLVKVDLDQLKEKEACLVTPIVITSGQSVTLLKEGAVLSAKEPQIVEVAE